MLGAVRRSIRKRTWVPRRCYFGARIHNGGDFLCSSGRGFFADVIARPLRFESRVKQRARVLGGGSETAQHNSRARLFRGQSPNTFGGHPRKSVGPFRTHPQFCWGQVASFEKIHRVQLFWCCTRRPPPPPRGGGAETTRPKKVPAKPLRGLTYAYRCLRISARPGHTPFAPRRGFFAYPLTRG